MEKGKIWFPTPESEEINGVKMSPDCQDFIKKLLVKDPSKRLGHVGGVKEVLAHPWLKSINPQDLLARKLKAPVLPELSEDKLDINCFDEEFTQQELRETEVPIDWQKKVDDNQELYEGFDKKQ